jgi:chromosome segregation ATPase
VPCPTPPLLSELESIRVKILKTFEASYQPQLTSLRSELRKYRDLYLQQHRECEIAKANVERLTDDHSHVMDDLRTLHERELNSWREKNHALQQMLSEHGDEERMSSLDREIVDVRVRNKELIAEIETLRKQRDDAVLRQKMAKTSLDRDRAAMEHTVLETKHQQQGEEKKYHHAVAELERAHQVRSQLDAEILRLSNENALFESRVQRIQSELRIAQAQLQERSQIATEEFAKERASLEQTVSNALAESKEAIRTRDEAVKKLATRERELASKYDDARTQHTDRVMELSQSNSELKAQVHSLREESAKAETQHVFEQQQLRQQLETMRAALESMTRERDGLRDRMESKHNSWTELSQRYQFEVKRSESLQSDLKQARDSADKSNSQLIESRREQEKATTELHFLRSEVESRMSDLKRDNDEHMHALRTRDDAWRRERISLQGHIEQLQTDMRKANDNSSETVARVKSDKNRYKKMCVLLKARLADMQKRVSIQRDDYTLQLKSSDLEIRSLRNQVQELVRQRDVLKVHLMQSKSLPSHSDMPVHVGGSRNRKPLQQRRATDDVVRDEQDTVADVMQQLHAMAAVVSDPNSQSFPTDAMDLSRSAPTSTTAGSSRRTASANVSSSGPPPLFIGDEFDGLGGTDRFYLAAPDRPGASMSAQTTPASRYQNQSGSIRNASDEVVHTSRSESIPI